MKILGPDHQPAVRAVGKKLSALLEPIECVWEDEAGNRFRLRPSTGFLFDGASIPRPLWSALGLAPHGVMDGPALFHDFPYHYQGKMPPGTYQFLSKRCGWIDMYTPMSRELADDLLHALVLHFKAAGAVKAWLIWSGVRAGGWAAWRRDDDNRKLKEFDDVFAAQMEGP